MDYNATVNLPKTDFPMRAGLPKREPDMLKGWNELELYQEMYKRNEGRPAFNLHDGPPFSNGMIHMGTAMNKCLKDFINRYKSMAGYQMYYVPGWDNHGMPIESAIIKEQKLNHKAMSVSEFRSACQKYAERYVDIQRDAFIRLGCLGDWANPYLTMAPKFEAEEIRVFGKMYEKGYIYKGLKPVYWCPHDETALAEAEIEYKDDPCTTVYVKFPMHDDQGKLAHLDKSKLFVVIWTTTIWTLPGNLAIALHPDESYAVVKAPNGEMYVMAEALTEKVMGIGGFESYEIVETHPGRFFENMLAAHPFLPKTSRMVLADYVTMDSGTGCVHTAPGFGADDYQTCRRYGMEMVVPVDDQGRHTDYAGKYAGLRTEESNPVILADMKESGALFASEDIIHSYPHCWRCKNPIIFRATPQWFCSVDAFKDAACEAADAVNWSPEWGHDRMISMIRERADWCISRQRRWGLPIPVFYCPDCGKPVCTSETIEAVAKIFAEKGSNAWFDLDASEFLGADFACPHCGAKGEFTKETDTLDGWFDSGSTHIASMELDAPGTWPCDIYLEGGDQYRGWFQSSLLIGVAVKGASPYRQVLTHGWTVDGEGKAMHKSLGNGVYPDEVIPKYGADLCRLWAASADHTLDMRCSDAIFKQLSDKYLKIRNTARYILGNLNGFDPDAPVAYADMLPLDKWAVSRLQGLIERCIAGYEKFEFHTVTYAIHNFCVVEMSNFYLDVIKDRLYCDGAESLSRRSAQTAIYTILDTITRLLAPILSFTADEIWLAMPHDKSCDKRNVCLNDMPKADAALKLSEEEDGRFQKLMAIRGDVNKALELARAEKLVGKPLDARITLFVSESAETPFAGIDADELRQLCIVSELAIVKGSGEGFRGEFDGLTVKVESSELPKCQRCWTHSDSVGKDAEHPTLCARCAAAIRE
ncbi:MAG: isoleucine--tRNA ligase [Ruminococcaceae bacterium]|nr:isoleucine--tRNA ligase [Oscillospiraceae bacterium]